MATPTATGIPATTFLLVFGIFVSLPFSRAASPDAGAMHELASSFHALPPGWSATSDPCDAKWMGVSCSPSSRVTSISLPSLSLSGTLPSTPLSSLTSLRLLSLHHNSLSGPLPSLPSPLPSLQELYLHDNNFSSLPLSFFPAFPNLLNLTLDRNPLSPWPLPSSISPHLSSFSASNSGASGPLPASLASLPGLTSLRLSYNSLSGPIPANALRASNLRELALNRQNPKLSGSIAFLSSMTQLQTAMLHSNNFTGPIPDLSNLTALEELLLRDNRLTGPVPTILPASLRRVALSNNLLQGPFPAFGHGVWEDAGDDGGGNSFCSGKPGATCDPRVTALLEAAGGFGYPLVIASSWKGGDPCGQWMFVNCDPQGNVKVLNFAGQQFGGMISPAIAEIATLEKVILSDNNLTGKIPDGLAKMPMLQLLDVSNNNLTGTIPSFQPEVLMYANNPFLGEEWDGGDSSEVDGGQGDGRHSRSRVWIVIVVVAFVMVAVGLLFFYHRKYRCTFQSEKAKKVRVDSWASRKKPVKWENLDSGAGSCGSCIVETEAVLMSMRELQQATGGFCEEKVLGRGGFGVVYKGELPDGALVAVKRMECGHMGKKGMTEFHAEIAVLTKLRHRHLVALLGYCIEGNERILVYEHMAEGTLGQHLFNGGKTGCSRLSWKQRLTIALDVARGLEYLHNLAHKSFIHRDLKPSNILLDGDMRAKVSDFGLVKLAPDEHSVHTRLAGTFGYLAPEYATTGKVTTKSDVYAFGVILLELITGRKALDDSLPDEHTHLVSWFRMVLADRDNLGKSVDSSLDLNEDDIKSVTAVAELAGHCIARVAHQRPDMGHVVNILAPLVDQWKPSSCNYGDSFSNIFQHGGIISAINIQSTTGLQS